MKRKHNSFMTVKPDVCLTSIINHAGGVMVRILECGRSFVLSPSQAKPKIINL
jgi:hypothetical protein